MSGPRDSGGAVNRDWMPVALDIDEHPKTLRLCRLLDDTKALWYVERLHRWCFKYARDGRPPVEMIEQVCQWKGDPGVLLVHLVEAGWLNRDHTVHDWMDGAGGFRDQLEDRRRRKRDEAAARRRVARPSPSESDDVDEPRSGYVAATSPLRSRYVAATSPLSSQVVGGDSGATSPPIGEDRIVEDTRPPPPASQLVLPRADAGAGARVEKRERDGAQRLAAAVREYLAPAGTLPAPDAKELDLLDELLCRSASTTRPAWEAQLIGLMRAIQVDTKRYGPGGSYPIATTKDFAKNLAEIMRRLEKVATQKTPAESIKAQAATWIHERAREVYGELCSSEEKPPDTPAAAWGARLEKKASERARAEALERFPGLKEASRG